MQNTEIPTEFVAQREALPPRRSVLRVALPILVVLGIVGGLVAIKASQIGMLIGLGKQMEKSGPPPQVVGDAVATKATWDTTLAAVGSVEAAMGVVVTNDAPGVVTKIHFESGTRVKQGDILVELDTSVERAQLASAIARRDFAVVTARRSRTLTSASVLSVSQLDADEATVKTSQADAAALQAQIARKVVRAPFAGKLGIRTVNIGQYLNPGTALTVLQSTDDAFVDFSVPQQRLGEATLGSTVRLVVGGEAKAVLEGKVVAVDPSVDPSTRSVKLRATAVDPDKTLRPGMFVNVGVVLGEKRPVVIVPVTALVHASYGDSVFVIEDKVGADGKPGKVARQQFVRTGETRGDFVSIDDGLKGGEDIVSIGAFKLRNGGGVVVDNTVGRKPELDPKPENR